MRDPLAVPAASVGFIALCRGGDLALASENGGCPFFILFYFIFASFARSRLSAVNGRTFPVYPISYVTAFQGCTDHDSSSLSHYLISTPSETRGMAWPTEVES